MSSDDLNQRWGFDPEAHWETRLSALASPCIGSGYCCKKSPCPLFIERYGPEEWSSPCPSLRPNFRVLFRLDRSRLPRYKKLRKEWIPITP